MKLKEGAFRRAISKTGGSALPSVLGLSVGIIIAQKLKPAQDSGIWVVWGILLLFFIALPFCLYLFIREREPESKSPRASGDPPGGVA